VSAQHLVILGATGSVGRSTLEVVAGYPEQYPIHALTAHRDAASLAQLCARFRPELAVIADESQEAALVAALDAAGAGMTGVRSGSAALVEVAEATEVDTVIAGIVGIAGLPATLAAAEAGKRILLANKEALVVAGALITNAVARSGGCLLPLDSEHNALFQCLPAGDATAEGVEDLVLTASGGPFRDWPVADLANVTPEQACDHPTWTMGRKISVDSATMMNKGLEIIEACWLFNLPPSRIRVLIHPQSVVHSLVRYCDGSALAQMGAPDMRIPIGHALAWPGRIRTGVEPVDLTQTAGLAFHAPEPARFPCLRLAERALAAGPNGPIVLNAANEVAVAAFLEGRIGFVRIAQVIEATLGAGVPEAAPVDLATVLGYDRQSRATAQACIDAEMGESWG